MKGCIEPKLANAAPYVEWRKLRKPAIHLRISNFSSRLVITAKLACTTMLSAYEALRMVGFQLM